MFVLGGVGGGCQFVFSLPRKCVRVTVHVCVFPGVPCGGHDGGLGSAPSRGLSVPADRAAYTGYQLSLSFLSLHRLVPLSSPLKSPPLLFPFASFSTTLTCLTLPHSFPPPHLPLFSLPSLHAPLSVSLHYSCLWLSTHSPLPLSPSLHPNSLNDHIFTPCSPKSGPPRV